MKILIMGAPTTNGYKAFGLKNTISGGGWVENLIRHISRNKSVQLSVCFYANFASDLQWREYDAITYYALPARVKTLDSCNKAMVRDLSTMLQNAKPDVVHIMGTEREYDLRLLELAGADAVVFSITGLVSYIAKHYYAGIEEKNFRKRTLGDYLRNRGPISEKKRFEFFGTFERQSLQMCQYVMGRTNWDETCVKQINPNIEYTHCGEILNPIFYQRRWEIKKTVKHRIFVSQASYPIKGIHQLLRAFPIIMKLYPDSEIVIAGPNILSSLTIMDKIKRTTYAKYLQRMIKQLKIPKDKIIYTGLLNAEEMVDQYLQANVFVLPSSIENSPNSLGEAMILGMPCVASCVGGVQDMVEDKKDGFLYPFNEYYMLAHYVCKIFSDQTLAINLGQSAHESARKRFEPETVTKITLDVYRRINDSKDRKNEL